MARRTPPPADISALLGLAAPEDDPTPTPDPVADLNEARARIHAQQHPGEPAPADPGEAPPPEEPEEPEPDENGDDDEDEEEDLPVEPARDDPTKDPLRPEDDPDVIPGQPGQPGRRSADDPTIVEPLDGDIDPPPKHSYTAYESRIRILEAWQYPARIPPDAPGWVDRNWISWSEYDEVRGIEAGPCLRVPLASGEVAVCRKGDYVCRQEVLMLADFPGDVRVEVWPCAQFEKLFMPKPGPDNSLYMARSSRQQTPSMPVSLPVAGEFA